MIEMSEFGGEWSSFNMQALTPSTAFKMSLSVGLGSSIE